MRCKDCIYYTGTQCHGHGEYWGSCILLKLASKNIQGKLKINQYITDNWLNARSEEDECLFLKKKLLEIKEIK